MSTEDLIAIVAAICYAGRAARPNAPMPYPEEAVEAARKIVASAKAAAEPPRRW